ncbi:GNAT family N-acetyltransferase [uncultured Methylibium sp.]|uniref:GNAT family N-acetyltransferase n=1 Tax=uncultured Methylibium sp. TaxID=381093 RepID=UPI0025D756D0|nr:GNAT family N-acetyltransferase [uncultured Methylibium sp.]
MSYELLTNVVWHSLTGPQAGCSMGAATARRYARGFSPIVAFADAARPDFAALAPHCDPGEQVYCAGWSGPVPPGWQLHFEAPMDQMVWDAPVPAADSRGDVVRLGPQQLAAMLALVAVTHPGPFGERTPELGEYYGVFDGPQLMAMTGERMQAGALREVSAVCTDPAFRGRGLAARLVHHVVRLQLQRGQQPFLQVIHSNAGARRLYEQLGFRHHQQLPLRVVSRIDARQRSGAMSVA